MKAFWEAIQFLFVDVLFLPMDLFRHLELSNWWLANLVNWVFIILGIKWGTYWLKQLSIFKSDDVKELEKTTAHSFLK